MYGDWLWAIRRSRDCRVEAVAGQCGSLGSCPSPQGAAPRSGGGGCSEAHFIVCFLSITCFTLRLVICQTIICPATSFVELNPFHISLCLHPAKLLYNLSVHLLGLVAWVCQSSKNKKNGWNTTYTHTISIGLSSHPPWCSPVWRGPAASCGRRCQ